MEGRIRISEQHAIIDIPNDAMEDKPSDITLNDEDVDDEETKPHTGDTEDHSILHAKNARKALLQIKCLPETMAEKRARKLAIKSLPKIHLATWAQRFWNLRNAVNLKKYTWQHQFRNIIAFQHSLRQIEIRCGTSVANVFLFVKWTLFLNVAITFMIILFIILPYYYMYLRAESTIDLEQRCDRNVESKYTNNISQRIGCCTVEYREKALIKTRGSIGNLFHLIFTNKTIEHSLFFYGYYMRNPKRLNDIDYFAALYVAVFVIILLFCLGLMVKNVGDGVQQLITHGDADFYKYANLIFAGWDHYTRDAAGAAFKHKILAHEMSMVLKTEKTTLAAEMRNKREHMFITFKRICVNIIVLIMIGSAAGIIYWVSGILTLQSQNFTELKGVDLIRNQVIGFAPSVVISFMNVIFPTVLTRLGKWEEFSPEKSTALVLLRALVIRLFAVGFVAIKFYIYTYCELKTPHHCSKCAEVKTLGQKIKITHRRSCWESLFADQIYKLILVDLLIKITLTFMVDPFRKFLKRKYKHFIFQKIGTMKFNIVRHSLDMIYLQVLSWLGMYFGPVIPVFAVFYCYVVFYIKKYSCLYNCTAVPDTFKAMRTTTIFVGAKLISYAVVLFVNVAVMGYMTPSRGCGPFRQFDKPWKALSNVIKLWKAGGDAYDSIASAGVTIPIVICTSIVCYYYFSVGMANREMVDTLRHLLIVEGHDKQYLFARLNTLRTEAEQQMKKRKTEVEAQRLQRIQVLQNINRKLELQKSQQSKEDAIPFKTRRKTISGQL